MLLESSQQIRWSKYLVSKSIYSKIFYLPTRWFFPLHFIWFLHSEALLAFRIQILGREQEERIRDEFSQSNPLLFYLGIPKEVKIIIILVKICNLKFQQLHLSQNFIFRIIILCYSCMHVTFTDFSSVCTYFQRQRLA